MSASEVPSHRLKRLKRALRRDVIERRDALAPPDRAERSRRIADRVLELPEVRGARTVMAFWPFGSEVDTRPLIEDLRGRGAVVALPRIEGHDLVAVASEPGGPTRTTGFGVTEPAGGAALEPGDVDVVLVPGVAFDRRGARVGYGRGFYDRFLPRTRPGVAALASAFAVQLVDEVPEGGADRRVDAIVTEDEVIRTSGPVAGRRT
jgi:5-formyltetrahydrofolate cyclo-ligase